MAINNSIELLHPDLRRVHNATLPKWKAKYPGGSLVGINETTRSAAVQTAYYARGRDSVTEVMRLYRQAGLYSIGPIEAGQKNSNARYGESPHNYLPSRAYDIRPEDARGNYLEGPHFEVVCRAWWALYKTEAVALGVEVVSGLTWGDPPHIELLHWRTMKS